MSAIAAPAPAPARAVVHTDAKPSGRQIYRLCRMLCDVAGLDFPETRLGASQLIDHVSTQLDAITGATPARTGTDDDIPF